MKHTIQIFLIFVVTAVVFGESLDMKPPSFSVIRKKENSNTYIVEPRQKEAKRQKKPDLTKLLNTKRKIDRDVNKLRDHYLDLEKARQSSVYRKTVKRFEHKRIKLFDKETQFYEGPRLPKLSPNGMSSRMQENVVLINGKSADTVLAGDPFTLTIFFAPNSISAGVTITADVNRNGVVDAGDIPYVTNGVVFDNSDDDKDRTTGKCSFEFEQGNLYSSSLTTLIFEVNNFQSQVSARLCVRQKRGEYVLVGTVTPATPTSIIWMNLDYNYQSNWERVIFPDSAGRYYVDVDIRGVRTFFCHVAEYGPTPSGYLAPSWYRSKIQISISGDTTWWNYSYTKADAFVEGYVRDQYGNPVYNSTITAYAYCWGIGCATRAIPTTKSDSSGYYKIGVGPDWGYFIYAEPQSTTDDYLFSFNEYGYVYTNVNKTVRRDLELIKSNSTISGKVTHDIVGVGGVEVDAYNDSIGNYTFTGIDGKYSVRIYKPDKDGISYTVDPYVDFSSGYVVDSTRTYVIPGATGVDFSLLIIPTGVEGKVTDSKTGFPVSRATINFSGPSYKSISSDDSGYFHARLIEGDYTVYAYSSLYETSPTSTITISGSVKVMNISLNRGASISGIVKDESELGIPLAEVYAHDERWAGGRITYTDESGHYTFGNIDTGPYKVQASAFGYVPQWYDKQLSKDSAAVISPVKGIDIPNIDFILSRGGSIAGVVKDKQGNALKSVFVTAFDTLFSAKSGSFTDTSGRYCITGLKTDQYLVQANRTDYLEQWYDGALSFSTATKVPVTMNQTTSGIDFHLTTGARINGRVTDRYGSSIKDARVDFVDSSFRYMAYSTADDSGSFSAGLLPYGIELYAAASAYGFVERWFDGAESFASATPITLYDGEIRNGVDFILPTAGSITGTVKNKAGLPIAGAVIEAWNRGIPSLNYDAESDSAGNYVIENMKNGAYTIWGRHGDYVGQYYNMKYWHESPDSVAVAENTVTSGIDFTLIRGGTISGTVKNIGGVALPGVNIYADGKNGNSMTSTEITGKFLLTHLVPGKYAVSSYHFEHENQYYNHHSLPIEADSLVVEDEQVVPDVNFDLTPASRDSLVVRILIDDLPDTLIFDQSHVNENYVEYLWGVRFDTYVDSSAGDPFELEIAMLHAKNGVGSPFVGDIIESTEHVVIYWSGNDGYLLMIPVRVWRDPSSLNTLCLAVSKYVMEHFQIGIMTRFYGTAMYYGLSGIEEDVTNKGYGEASASDQKGDVPHRFIDILSTRWKKEIAMSVKDDHNVPSQFALQQNYPNPFNPTTVIRYQLPVISKVTLKIYDVLGREVATLVHEEQSAGWKEVQWNASGFASGMYLIRMQAGSFTEVKKILLVK